LSKNAPIQLEDSMNYAKAMPLRLEVCALGEGLRIGEPLECQQVALRLIEIAGYGQRRNDARALGPMELVTGLSGRWRARYAESALRSLAVGWGNLSIEMRTLALALGRRRWINVTKELAKDADAEIRTTALSIARDTGDPGLGVMVCSLLGDEHQKVRLAADRTLLALVLGMMQQVDGAMLGEEYDSIRNRRVTAMLGDPAVLELERCSMLAAIADAAWSFSSHRCRSPLLASLLLMDRQGATSMERRAFEKMRRLLSERHHPSHMPMRTVLRTTAAPILRERALRWLVVDPIANVAAARLDIAESIAEHRAVLDNMHLCVRPMRARGLNRVRVASRQEKGSVILEDNAPFVNIQEYGEIDHDAKRGYIRWVTGLSLDAGVRRQLLERVMADSDASIRLHGCCVADAFDLVDYLYDSNEAVSRHAAVRWSSVGATTPAVGSASCERRLNTARLNQRSSSAWVRRVADEEVERLSIDMAWSPSSRLQARRLFASDPARFVRLIREMLHQPARRSSGVEMILALGLEERFEMDLVSLGNERGLDPRLSATLVRGLSKVDSDAARASVLQSLECDDQRVVANAIESVHTPIESLVEYKGDEHHRVRSSAIRRMLVSDHRGAVADAAVEDLLGMLTDARVGHRLAGVWAAQRVFECKPHERLVGWRDLVSTLDEMTRHETDDAVRARADQCVHRLLVQQRTRVMEGAAT
jgi:hypothetical protein